jgi:hypothetical protein
MNIAPDLKPRHVNLTLSSGIERDYGRVVDLGGRPGFLLTSESFATPSFNGVVFRGPA